MSDQIQEEDVYENQDTMTLILDNGAELECAVVTTLEAGGKDYIALLPLEGVEAEEGDVFLYRFHVDENGDPELENIESDEEYEIVSDAFDEWLDTQEYDELVDEDDLEEE